MTSSNFYGDMSSSLLLLFALLLLLLAEAVALVLWTLQAPPTIDWGAWFVEDDIELVVAAAPDAAPVAVVEEVEDEFPWTRLAAWAAAACAYIAATLFKTCPPLFWLAPSTTIV